MRVSILTFGSRGDVQPYLALAVGLQASGYSVRIASHAIFESWIRSYGIDFALVRFNPKDIVSHPEAQRAKSNILRFMLAVRRLLGTQYFDIFDDFWEACQDAEAIIASPTVSNARECAETLGIPLVLGLLQPLLPTREFPSFFLPPLPRLGGTLNKASHHLLNQLLWQNARANINRWRRERLSLGSAPLFGPYSWMERVRVPQLVACSPALIPRPSDWRQWHHLTGFWYLEQLADFKPPPEVVSFLESGSPPVYVGFGSMDDEQPERVTDVVIQALERSNQRGILATGWGGLERGAIPDSVLHVDEIPHSWLFPRVAAIIHHGGAGTTASALYSGTPSVVVPFGGDQYHWGRLLVERGLSPTVLPVKDIDPISLAGAISELVADPGLRSRASSFGTAIRAEQGISRAISIIESYWRG